MFFEFVVCPFFLLGIFTFLQFLVDLIFVFYGRSDAMGNPLT